MQATLHEPVTRPGASVDVQLRINSRAYPLSIDPRATLLDVLRERIGLTGAKKGCDHGQCGACTVRINGHRALACLAFAIAHQHDEIITIEGLADGETLHPMQTAFIECDAFQCGFCTPGQIMSAVCLLDEAQAFAPAELSDADIREAMSGNICRCGAYPNILAAIRQVQGRASGRRQIVS